MCVKYFTSFTLRHLRFTTLEAYIILYAALKTPEDNIVLATNAVALREAPQIV